MLCGRWEEELTVWHTLSPHIRSEDHYSLEYVLYHFRIRPPVLHQQPASIMKILILIVC